MHAEIRTPANGCDFSKRSRIWARTGILRSAHSMRLRPSAASDASAMSCFGSVAVTGTFTKISLRGNQINVWIPNA